MEILNLGSHRIGVRFPEKGLRKGKNPAILLNDGELIEQLNLRTERAVLVGYTPITDFQSIPRGRNRLFDRAHRILVGS